MEKREFYDANQAWMHTYIALNSGNDREVIESAPRGLKIRELIDYDIKIMNPDKCLVHNKFRGLSPQYIAKEFYWYLSGDNSVEEASKLSKFWATIANEDGTVNSNYGYYIFRKGSGIDPNKSVWEETIELFKKDIDTRHGIIQIPIMPVRGTKDTPCTSSIHFIVRNNKLYCTVLMRSTDVILGAPIDWFQFCSWQCMMAQALGVELGWFRFISDSIHCYEKHFYENITGKDFNINDFRDMCGSKQFDYSRLDIPFVEDIDRLSGGCNNLDELNTPILKEMLDNKKIWR